MEIPTFKNIAELHEYVFQLLLAEHIKDNTFLFTLRSPQHFRENLEGHWFYGKEDYLYFSFWKSSDTASNMPYIYYFVNLRGACLLKINHSVAPILLDLIKEHIHNITLDNLEKRYISILDLDNIQYDKGIIDSMINEILRENYHSLPKLNIKFISAIEFETNLQYIEKLRKNGLTEIAFQEKVNSTIKTIKLESLSITNITHFKQLDLIFAKRITCIIGENGSGKSTILRAIAFALVGTDKKRINIQHKNIMSLLQIKGQNAGVEEYSLEGKIELFYNEKYRNQISFSFEYGDLTITQNGDFKNIDTYYFPHLILGFSQLQGKNENSNSVSIIKNDKANIKDIRGLIYGEPNSYFEEFGRWIMNLFAEGNKKDREKSKEHQIIAQLFGIISSVIGAEVNFITVNHDEEKVWVSTPDAPNGITLDLLSQGYSNVFGWIGYFMKRLAEVNPHAEDFMQCPAIVFIDEIDTYLHPKWQQSILSTLVTKFPNIQFVITTHSPIILSNLDSSIATAYDIQNGKAIEITHFYGKRIQDIYYQYYGIKERTAKAIVEKIDQLDDAMIDEDKEKIQAGLNELLPILGEDDPVIWDAKAQLEKLS